MVFHYSGNEETNITFIFVEDFVKLLLLVYWSVVLGKAQEGLIPQRAVSDDCRRNVLSEGV